MPRLSFLGLCKFVFFFFYQLFNLPLKVFLKLSLALFVVISDFHGASQALVELLVGVVEQALDRVLSLALAVV